MHSARIYQFVLTVFATCAANLQAQSPIPVRELSPAEATSADHFGAILGVRPLAGGKVLVNDGRNHQLVMLDANLAKRTVIIDSVAAAGQSYGPRASPLITYLADSSLFVDGSSLSLLVLSPAGAVVRVMSAAKPTDLRYLAASASGVDARGNLVYRGVIPTAPANPAVPGSVLKSVLTPEDSMPIVRANFDTRTVDTLGRVKMPVDQRVSIDTTGGRTAATVYLNPLSSIDEWAVLSDGSVLFVRGHDYHVEVLRADGKKISSPKLPFDWKRLSDDDKKMVVDSARTAREKEQAAMKSAAARPPSGDMQQQMEMQRMRVREGAAAGAGAPAQPANQTTFKFDFVAPSEIVDYWPPIRSGAVKADLDGNAWILPTTSAQSKAGELIYDVVNNRGELTHRVRVPSGRSIAGFGHNGVVYLMRRDGEAGWLLERSKVLAAVRTP